MTATSFVLFSVSGKSYNPLEIAAPGALLETALVRFTLQCLGAELQPIAAAVCVPFTAVTVRHVSSRRHVVTMCITHRLIRGQLG